MRSSTLFLEVASLQLPTAKFFFGDAVAVLATKWQPCHTFDTISETTTYSGSDHNFQFFQASFP